MANRYPRQDVIVGLDCVWQPNTASTMNNRTATLQLCIGSRCIIIQLIHVDYISSSLSGFLASPNVVCVGVNVARDVDKLRSEYGITVASTEDLRDMALYSLPNRFSGWPGLKTIALVVLGLHMPKPEHVTRSDWQRWYLDDEQIEYACLDAYASCKIGMRLLS